jgi:hypothetical protein
MSIQYFNLYTQTVDKRSNRNIENSFWASFNVIGQLLYNSQHDWLIRTGS